MHHFANITRKSRKTIEIKNIFAIFICQSIIDDDSIVIPQKVISFHLCNTNFLTLSVKQTELDQDNLVF